MAETTVIERAQKRTQGAHAGAQAETRKGSQNELA
jgi:hypothetical protein